MSAIRSFVRVKAFKSTTDVGRNMNGLRLSLNRLGRSTTSIGKSFESSLTLLEFQKSFIQETSQKDRVYEQAKDREKKLLASRLKIQERRAAFRKRREDSAKLANQLAKEKKEAQKKEAKEILTPFKKMLARIGGFFGTLFGAFALFGGLTWMQKNGEAIKTVFKVVASLVKFTYKIASFGIGQVFNGMVRMFGTGVPGENKIQRVFRFFTGGLQFLVGLAALKGAQYILMPWKLFGDVNKLRDIFSNAKTAEEGANQATQRVKSGYYDKKTGRYYTKQEYNTMRKAARKKPGGIKSFENRVKPTTKISGMRMGATRRMSNAFKGIKGRIPGGGATMLAGATSVVGGLSRAFAGDQEGEAAGTAVGAGVGKAIGGVAGAAAGGALLPFLGPFGPMIGAAIGDFLGGFIGSKIGPIVQPIFEPMARAFGMMKEIFLAPLMPVIEPMKELLGTFFKALGNIVSTIMKAITPIMKFVGLVLGGAMKTIFRVLSFTFNLIKNIVAFTLNPIGFAWDVIRRKDPGRDVDINQVANAKGSEKQPDLEQFDKGGKYFGKFFNAEVITGNADNKQLIKPKVIIQKPNVAEPEEFAAGGIFRFALRKSLVFFATGMIAVLKKAVAKLERNDVPTEEKDLGGDVKVPYDFVKSKLGVDSSVWDTYRNTLAGIESSDNYLAIGGSEGKYDGRYQMGAMAKTDGARMFGIQDPGHSLPMRIIFRRNKELQENLLAGYTAANMSYLSPSKEFMERSKLDQMAILGYAHNTGWNAALKWLQSGEVSEDGFGTKSTKFYEALKKAFADQIQLPESSAKPTSIPDPAAKGSKEESDSEVETKEETKPQAKKGNLLNTLASMAKNVLQDGIDLIQPHLTPPPTAGTSTDYSDKIKTSAQQQKDLESGVAMAGNIVPVSVPVPINSGGQGGGQNTVQIFTPLHPAIHK